jgi:crotonobetainyl-CoA:carnitine CoA-transferase CaiB-like acyl-CoA transferase
MVDGTVHGRDLPLEGLVVLDFTRILSGPYASMLLADLGADVIKVERPHVGDDTRSWGPPFANGTSTYFAAVNRGKRSIAVDTGLERGRAILRGLACRADVLIENFRPGVTERLGLDYERLSNLNPRLVYATINGFGSRGPKASLAGTEVIVEAESGLMAMMGEPGRPPVRFGVAMVDIATGLALVSGVLAALLQREQSGRGRRLEFPLYSTAFSALSTVIASASVDPGSQAGRWGSAHPSIVPYSAFEARDGHLVVGAINDEMWERLCEALDLHTLRGDERCATNELRVRNRELVERELARALTTETVEDAVLKLRERGVLAAPVNDVTTAVEDVQVAELGLLQEDDGVLFARTPLAQFNGRTLARAPALGEHSRAVLHDYLDVDAAELDELESLGVVQSVGERLSRPRVGAVE